MGQLVKITECESSTLFGMNGGQPESPDALRLVYARKKDLTNAESGQTEIWICDRDLNNHRNVFTVECGNHNGPSATFVDNSRIVFRDIIDGFSAFRILNIDTGEVEFGPGILARKATAAKTESTHFPYQRNSSVRILRFLRLILAGFIC